MQRRPLRVTIVLVLAVILGVAAWTAFDRLRSVEAVAADDATALVAFTGADRALSQVAASQRAYVAPDQGLDFWTRRVDDEIVSARESLLRMRAALRSAEAIASVDSALSRLDDFSQMDQRVRALLEGGQRTAASNLIFADGYEILNAAQADAAAALPTAGTAAAATASGNAFALRAALVALAGASAVLLLLLLLSGSARKEPAPAVVDVPAVPAPEAGEIDPIGAALDASLASDLSAVDAAPGASRIGGDEMALPATSTAPVSAPAALPETADVCVDLARLLDARDLEAVLARASAALASRGLIVWLVDEKGAALMPALTHGYPPSLVGRLGALPMDADNATAAAWRARDPQVVPGSAERAGALAVPMLTSSGCAGVLALEFDGGREREDDVRALARIIAAQLASSIAPAPAAARRAAEG